MRGDGKLGAYIMCILYIVREIAEFYLSPLYRLRDVLETLSVVFFFSSCLPIRIEFVVNKHKQIT